MLKNHTICNDVSVNSSQAVYYIRRSDHHDDWWVYSA